VPRRRKDIAPSDEKLIGRRLRELRLRQGLTQAEVAGKVGLNQPLVSQYERGDVRLHGALVARFAKALKASADEILGIDHGNGDDGAPQDRRFVRRLQKIETLPDRSKQVLLKTIDTFLKGSGVE
jgi:transcriptional regulator with XRE-family HTH domain